MQYCIFAITIPHYSSYMKPNITSRDKDFIEACQSVLSHCSCDSRPCMRAIVASAIASPAPSYYVSPDYAFRIMSSYLNHGKLPSRRLAREMWLEIASKVTRLRRENPSIPLIKAVTEVTANEHASRFFISDGYALRLLQRRNRSSRLALKPNLLSWHDGGNPFRRSPRHIRHTRQSD